MTLSEKYIKLFVQDVKSFPECYKERIIADPAGHAKAQIDGLTDKEIAQCINDLKEEQKNLAKYGYYLKDIEHEKD